MFPQASQVKCHIGKRRPKIQELQPIEYLDLIPPKEEKDSTDSEDESENQRKKSFVKKLRVKSSKFSKDNDQIQTNPIIKDLIINKEENIVDDKKDNWGFESTNDFFKQQNMLKKYNAGS